MDPWKTKQVNGLRNILRDASMLMLPGSVVQVDISFLLASLLRKGKIHLGVYNTEEAQMKLATEILGGQSMPIEHVRITPDGYVKCFFRQASTEATPYFLAKGKDGVIYALNMKMGGLVYDLFVENCTRIQ